MRSLTRDSTVQKLLLSLIFLAIWATGPAHSSSVEAKRCERYCQLAEGDCHKRCERPGKRHSSICKGQCRAPYHQCMVHECHDPTEEFKKKMELRLAKEPALVVVPVPVPAPVKPQAPVKQPLAPVTDQQNHADKKVTAKPSKPSFFKKRACLSESKRQGGRTYEDCIAAK
jgi:hypothetical protein